MDTLEVTREEMWAKQSLSAGEVDYALWDRHRDLLSRMAKTSRSCMFVVDVCKCRYAFASSDFADLLGYDRRKIDTLERQGDYLESRIHPDDLLQLKSMQVGLSRFIYGLPAEDRNHYRNTFTYRILNAKRRYVNVTGRHQVLETSTGGKAWLILGMTDIASEQKPLKEVGCSVLNLKTGEIFSPFSLPESRPELTSRETEILQLISRGLLSKEIACKLGISIHTVNNHRKNVLAKLNVDNIIEAINITRDRNIIY